MSVFGVFAVLITATALLAWFNERFLRLPSTIGVMAAALVLALALPASPQRALILVVTYAIVVFSILVQGLSLGRFVRWAVARERLVTAQR